MAKDFIRRLRDAFLVFDPEDKANVERYLIASGTDWNSCLLSNSDFILKRVKRRIPPPDELLPVVKFLFEKYGPLRCSRTNLPLFDEQANQAAANILESIRLGHISDLVDGPALYTEKGLDKNGLMLYKCSRGTNSVEGSCHTNIIRRSASYNASTRLTDAILADYRLFHNINVGAINRYGKKKHTHHYSPWIPLAVNLLRQKVGHSLINDYFMDRIGSFLSCEHTSETFGIVKMPPPVMNSYRILSNNEVITQPSRFNMGAITVLAALPLVCPPTVNYSTAKFAYVYLAKCQGTEIAVTAVQTKEEIALFESLLSTQGESSTLVFSPFDAEHPDFLLFATTWNSLHCFDGSNNIYYKTPEHIKSYYNILEDRKKYGLTVMQNWEVSREVRLLVEDTSRLQQQVIPTNPPPSPPSAPANFSEIVNPPLALELPPRPFVRLLPINPPIIQIVRRVLVPATNDQATPEESSPRGSKRRRICSVCDDPGCSGSSRKELCSNKCGKYPQDDCPGKHIKAPLTGKRKFVQPSPCVNRS